MRIACPHCGLRANSEFVYCGDASLTRPAPRLGDAAEDATAREWMDYVYFRKNPFAAQREYWQHAGGCRAVLELTREPSTHDILAVKLAGDAP